ncbi:uncharacterized protein V3H82_014810 [Fundulus diaphanus]
MLDKEVDAGAQEETSEGVLIRVAEHKTSAQFGEATLALTQREFSWVKRLRDIKSRLSIKNKYLLFTMGKLPFRNIVRYLNFAWKKMGLGSAINFILIRTALANSAKSALTPKERNKVSTFMCHDTKTADRFYVLNPSLQEAIRIRTLITDSLSKVASREKPSSSSAAHKRRAKKAGPAPKSTKAKGEWSNSEEEEEENEEDEEAKEEEENEE